MDALAVLRGYFSASLRAQLQYPGSSLLLGFGAFLTTIIELAGIWALFHRFGSVQGWRFGEIAFFFGMNNIGGVSIELGKLLLFVFVALAIVSFIVSLASLP